MYQRKNRKKIIFLGTPAVAAMVLEQLIQKTQAIAQVVLVITQAATRSSRNSKLIPSATHNKALEYGIPVFTPEDINSDTTLADLAALEPDLCITAAYGNYLSGKFLALAKYGTINIHPSLLPLYRGAAPVQRAIEQGNEYTGVSILYTVKEMDAGPIIAQKTYQISDKIQTPELLKELFTLGMQLLIDNLYNIFSAICETVTQNSQNVSYAPKISAQEAWLNFSLPAKILHNKVRAFMPWPGAKLLFKINEIPIECKITRSEIVENTNNLTPLSVVLEKNSIDICCIDNKIFRILELQPTGKKLLLSKDFINGLHNKSIELIWPNV